MKFSCDRCTTRYSIGDEKVRGKVLKIRCKTCGNIIVVREQGVDAGAQAPIGAVTGTAQALQTSSLQTGSLQSGMQAGTGSLQSGMQASMQAGMQTPMSQQAGMQAQAQMQGGLAQQAMQASSMAAGATGPLPPTPSGSMGARGAPVRPAEVEWYVAIKGKQHGPCKKDDIVRLYRDAKITERTYLWNETMAAWTRLRDLPAFAGLLAEGPPKPKPPPPPPSEEQQQGAEIIPFDEVKRARESGLSGGFGSTGASGVGAITNDPFAAVSQPLVGGDQAPRDSTRVFIMQAGLANRSKKHRMYAAIAAGAFVVIAGVFALDYEGVIEIPGLHSVVAAVAPKKSTGPSLAQANAAAWDDVEEDPKLKCKLAGAMYDDCVKKVVASNFEKRAHKQATMKGAAGIDLQGAFNTADPASGDGSLHKGASDGGGLAGGGISDADRAGLLALQHDEKKAARVNLPALGDIKPQIEGQDLDPKNVASVVKQNEPAIQDCIEKAAKNGALPRGKQWLSVSVEPNGRVSAARFKDGATNASDCGECIVRSAKKWKFAAFPGTTTDVDIPLILSLN